MAGAVPAATELACSTQTVAQATGCQHLDHVVKEIQHCVDAEVCAAEPAWDWRPGALLRIAGEAAYVCLTDIGTRWARLTRNTRMLARVT